MTGVNVEKSENMTSNVRSILRGAARIVASGTVMVLAAIQPAMATLVTIDEKIFQQDGSVNPAVLAGTADLSVSGSTLTIVLTNTSTGATGGAAATNLLVGIGFNLPGGVTILNDGETNTVGITSGSSAIGFSGAFDNRWGAANGTLAAINDKTLLGDVNASASSLQPQINFDLSGTNQPPANVNGPDYGLLSSLVSSSTCNSGLACIQSSATLKLALNGSWTGDLVSQINNGHVVLSFGSPTTPPSVVPEPGSLALFGLALAGLGWTRRRKQS